MVFVIRLGRNGKIRKVTAVADGWEEEVSTDLFAQRLLKDGPTLIVKAGGKIDSRRVGRACIDNVVDQSVANGGKSLLRNGNFCFIDKVLICGDRYCRKNCNDCHHDQQFDQGETGRSRYNTLRILVERGKG